MSQTDKYLQRGVSATKEDVHKAIEGLNKGLVEKSFCKIFPDFLAGDDSFCNLMSSDGSGTKSVIAYLYWKETGDASVFRGIAQDVAVMNLDDLLCVGARGPFIFSSVINRNKGRIPGEIISALIQGTAEFFSGLKKHGVQIEFLGGETADLGDIVQTLTIDGTMSCRLPKEQLIRTSNIQKGDVIVGLYSHGQTTYESAYNSGIGSNGLTSARHDLLGKEYLVKYPESIDEQVNPDLLYSGKHRLTDHLAGTDLSIGKALLSPTRTFAPILAAIFDSQFPNIKSIVHCTGGGQGKALHFMDGVKLVLNEFPSIPPLFQEIQRISNCSWSEMFRVYNMGVRMQLFVAEETAEEIIKIAASFNLGASIIGHVEKSASPAIEIKYAGEQISLTL